MSSRTLPQTVGVIFDHADSHRRVVVTALDGLVGIDLVFFDADPEVCELGSTLVLARATALAVARAILAHVGGTA